jgi:hypothetical protein
MTQSEWQELYKAALLEFDPMLLPMRVHAARNAIHIRLTEERQPLSKREFEDIQSALRILGFLLRKTA